MWFIGVEVEQETSAPPPKKKILDPPLNRRLHLHFEENKILHNSQIGFLPENRTADHVFTLRTLIDKYVHYHKEKVCTLVS